MLYPMIPLPGLVILPVVVPFRPVPIPARMLLLGTPGPAEVEPGRIGRGPSGIGFGAGPAAIEPDLEWFRAGHAIGGPSGTFFRGGSTSSFPQAAVVLGSGAPLAREALGLAGSPIGFFP